jgi:twitching motility protein PilT
MSLELFLTETARAGGIELLLAAGRPIVVRSSEGEREVRNSTQTTATILRLLKPVLPPEARQKLDGGMAEWAFPHPTIGEVKARVELTDGEARASFRLAGEKPLPSPTPMPMRMSRVGHEIDRLFEKMVELGASDLHISSGMPPMIRHDGEMRAMEGWSALSHSDVERLLWPIAPTRNREEFDAKRDTDFAYEIPGLSRFRANFFCDRKGVGAVFRVIPTKILTAEQMGLSKEILDLCFLPKGLILVTGPTGSGKSTTLTALVDHMNRIRRDHIITIEDPIEFVHESKSCLINQRQVGEHTESFSTALRAALREDPDVVLVGEMRDLETVEMAIETAETGHLVLGTLHTSSAASTVDRIIDQFPADRQQQVRTMLASSLKGVISQMLCRKIGGGRVPAMEVLIGTPSISNLIREGKTFQIPSMMQTGRKVGMRLMNDSLLELVKEGIVEPSEALAKSGDKAGLIAMLRSNGIELELPAQAVA